MIACPKCGNGDRSQKVSGVVGTGKGTGTFSGPTGGVTYSDGKWGTVGGYTTLSGTQMTDLAKMLAAPSEPKLDTAWGLKLLGCFFYLCVIQLFILCVPMLPMAMLVPSALLNLPTWLQYSVGIGASVVSLIMLAAVSIVGIRLLLGMNTRQKEQAAVRYAAQQAWWHSAMDRWNRLYYCFFDDLVFDPETGESCRPQEMQKFIYQGAANV